MKQSKNLNKLKPSLIYITAFLTGAAVLIIEVIATRILSPYFGMTLFSVSGILSVILASLSLGYWQGGKLADQYPKRQTLYTVIFLSGLTTLLIQIGRSVILPQWGEKMDVMLGPLFSSMMLFFIPTLFLGMVSPIAIRLATERVQQVGQVAGKVFFFGTLGSIIGSLSAGFILIPKLPISWIIIGTGLLLMIIGLLGASRKVLTKIPLFLGLIVITLTLSTNNLSHDPNLIYEEDSSYQHIKVLRWNFEDGEGRLLKLDRSHSGAIYLNSKDLPFAYTRYYRLYKLTNKDAQKFLFLGSGAYAPPQKLLSERKDAIEVDVVDIDPRLPEIAKKFFGFTDDKRMNLITADARDYLTKSSRKYDVIAIDVYMDIAIPTHLATKEFFNIVNQHLNKRGMMVMNVIANIEPTSPSLGNSIIKTFREIFKNGEVLAFRPKELGRIQNILLWGVNDDEWQLSLSDPSIIDAESEEIKSIGKYRVSEEEIQGAKGIILTDDYAPIDFLAAKMLNMTNQRFIEGNGKED